MNYPIYVTVVIHCSRYEMGECNTSCTCTQKKQAYQACTYNEYGICFICRVDGGMSNSLIDFIVFVNNTWPSADMLPKYKDIFRSVKKMDLMSNFELFFFE